MNVELGRAIAAGARESSSSTTIRASAALRKALLTAEGFDVVGEAVDGASALALVDELAPELVLLDIQLPDIDGFEVARRLLEPNPSSRSCSSRAGDSSQYGPLIDGERRCAASSRRATSPGAALERLLD